jgi:hypothetical protein
MTRNDEPSAPSSSSQIVWAIAVTVIVIVAMLIAAGLYVFQSLRALPGEAVTGTQKILHELQTVAGAFRQGTVTTRFISYAATISGSNYLQFATLRQTEVFTREDQASVLWGTLELPDIVVSATTPVEYTAYLDLNDEWHFRIDGRRLYVLAPEIRFNTPAIDASEIRYEVRRGSLLRDEDEALDKLKAGLTEMSMQRTREHLPLVRELGRRKTEEFVERWLVQSFGDGSDYDVTVYFADESPPPEELDIPFSQIPRSAEIPNSQ